MKGEAKTSDKHIINLRWSAHAHVFVKREGWHPFRPWGCAFWACGRTFSERKKKWFESFPL